MMEFWTVYWMGVAAMLGACVGSFLNVCIHRIPREESIVTPRSHCPHCNRLIAWYDNLPLISWLVLRARCRHCGGRISARYITVELITALLFLAVWITYGASSLTPVYWLMISGLLLGMFVDFEHMIIPDRVTWGGMIAGVILSVLLPGMHGVKSHLAGLLYALAGAAVGFWILWSVGGIARLLLKRDAMGFGDVKLLGAIGAFLGWQAVLFVIVVSSFLGSFVGIGLIVGGSKKWRSRIPYGPYLAVAAIFWVLGGKACWLWYLNWLTQLGRG